MSVVFSIFAELCICHHIQLWKIFIIHKRNLVYTKVSIKETWSPYDSQKAEKRKWKEQGRRSPAKACLSPTAYLPSTRPPLLRVPPPPTQRASLSHTHFRSIMSHEGAVVQYVTFCAWLLSLDMFSRLIHVVACPNASFLFLTEWKKKRKRKPCI
jgi:hypothetical protein